MFDIFGMLIGGVIGILVASVFIYTWQVMVSPMQDTAILVGALAGGSGAIIGSVCGLWFVCLSLRRV